MLDFVLIQNTYSGIEIFKYRGPNTEIETDHAFVLSGFLSAIQALTRELKLGNITQISTDSHHCIFFTESSITTIVIVDLKDCPKLWMKEAIGISKDFLECYQNDLCINNLTHFKPFKKKLLKKLNLTEIIYEICPCQEL